IRIAAVSGRGDGILAATAAAHYRQWLWRGVGNFRYRRVGLGPPLFVERKNKSGGPRPTLRMLGLGVLAFAPQQVDAAGDDHTGAGQRDRIGQCVPKDAIQDDSPDQ